MIPEALRPQASSTGPRHGGEVPASHLLPRTQLAHPSWPSYSHGGWGEAWVDGRGVGRKNLWGNQAVRKIPGSLCKPVGKRELRTDVSAVQEFGR